MSNRPTKREKLAKIYGSRLVRQFCSSWGYVPEPNDKLLINFIKHRSVEPTQADLNRLIAKEKERTGGVKNKFVFGKSLTNNV